MMSAVNGIFRVLAYLFVPLAVLSGAVLERNTVRGLYQLNDSLSAVHSANHAALATSGFGIGVSPVSRYVTEGGGTYLVVNSSTTPNAGLKATEKLLVSPGIAPNGVVGATAINDWSIVMDVRVPAISNFTSLVQCQGANTEDAEIFFNSSGQLQIYGASNGAASNPVVSNILPTNTWVRLGFTSSYDSVAGKNVLRVYVNGTETVQSAVGTLSAPVNGRLSLTSQFALFSDESGETNVCHLGSLGVWGRALFATDMSELGTYAAGGITWAGITPASGTPPLPLLTGRIFFGDFQGNYTPPTGSSLVALANSARSPSNTAYVCDVTLPLSTFGGTVMGFPNHFFGGSVNVGVAANGDVVALGGTSMAYIPAGGSPAADVGVASNVTYVRTNLRLTTTGLMGDVKLYFPAGMSVAMDDTTRRSIDRVLLGFLPLDQNMVPKSDRVITKIDFPDGLSGTIYPCTERVPVRFAASSITWSRLTGRFTFGQIGTPIYHQQAQLTTLTGYGNGVRGRAVPASNDLYFLTARTVSGNVVIGSRSGEIATNEQLTLSLDPQKFGQASALFTAHFPRIPVKWTGAGSIIYAGNQISASSNLPNASTTLITYRRNLPIADCKGLPGANDPNVTTAYFLPSGRLWRISQDGGLKASGTLGAGYDASTDSPTGSYVPSWVGYNQGGTNFYGQIVSNFTTGRVLIAGQACVGSEISALSLQAKVYGILYSGHGVTGNEALVERPGTNNYNTGAADYPGLNLRASASPVSAVSRIAGAATPAYPLAANAKYYIRFAGVSGLHASSAATPISLSAYGGAAFNLSSLQLSYLDGVNNNSGVTGNVTVPTPDSTSFILNMKRVLLGPQGQIAEAKLLAPQPAITLGYWNFAFQPLAIDFPQPKGCPPPSPAEGFIRISASATLPTMVAAGKTVTGTLGFHSGDLVTEGMAIGADYPGISRFQPGGNLQVPGPSGKVWNVICTSGIYLNNKAASNPDPGSLNAGGQMDVPFFNDMPVHLRATSSSGGTNPVLHVRSQLALQGSEANYDISQLGRPTGTPLAFYLNTGLDAFNPLIERKWQDLVTFRYPVAYQTATNTFRSVAPVTNSVLLFDLKQGVKDMTPDNADLVFDGEASAGIGNLTSQVNFSKLVGAVLPGNISSFAGPARDAVKGLEKITSDQTRDLIKPAMNLIGAKYGSGAFFNSLSASSTRSALITGLLAAVTSDVMLIHSSGSGISGEATRTVTSEIDTAINGLTAGKNLVTNANHLKNLAAFLGAGSSGEPEAKRLAELASVFDRAIADLQTAKDGLGSPLNTAMNRSSGGLPLIRSSVQAALDDLLKKWAPTDSSKASAMYATATATDFANDLANALADRVLGSAYAGESGTIIRQQLADAQFLSRQVLDDTIALAASLLPASGAITSLAARGTGINDKLAGIGIKGYAHINGDSLTEVRLDGEATLNVGDEMKFKAFFLLKSVDSSTPGGACLAAGGAKAEVTMGASTNLSWTGQDADIALQGKVAFDGTGSPVGFFGDLRLVGELDFSEIQINELALGFGFGIDSDEAIPGNAKQYYLYGKAVGKVAAMDVAAGIFIGRTCMLDPIKNADPDIGRVVASQNLQPPYTGAAVYAYGAISLMPIIGIPPSCLLDLRVGGGQGFFAFTSGANGGGPLVVGFKTTQSVSGELLCLASVKAKQDTVIAGQGIISGGSPRLISVTGDSRFTASGKVGIGYFSYTFKKSVGLIITANPKIKTRIDY